MMRLTKRDEYDYINDKKGSAFTYTDIKFCGDSYMGEAIDKLAEYEDLEEQGLLLRLPCKVGDTVYGLVNYCNDCPNYDDYCHRGCTKPTYRLKEFQVDHFEINNNDLKVSALSHYQGEGKWGETVFLMKEEAEEKLEDLLKQTFKR